MAIDPTIALGVQPLRSPLDSYGRALQVQNLATQGKMGQIGLEQAQTSLAQQQALNKAYADPANRNPDGSINYNAVANSLAKGGAGSLIPGVMKGGMEAQQQTFQLDEEKHKDLQIKNDRVADSIIGLLSDPALNQEKIKQTMDLAFQRGDLDQAHYQQALQTMPQAADVKSLKAWLAQLAAVNFATGAKLQQLTPQVKVQNVGGSLVPVTTTQATGETAVGTPLAQDTEQQRHNKAMEDIGWYRAKHPASVLVSGAGQNPNFDPTQPLAPAEESQAKIIADGGNPLTPSSRNPRAMLINARARQLYADANGGDATGFGTAKGVLTKGRESFAPGGYNMKTVGALDTAIYHLDTLKQLGDALQNGDNQTINKLGNSIAGWSGSAAPTNFNMTRKIALDEVAKAVAGANMTESDRKSLEDLVSTASSPAQLAGAIKTAQELLGGKIKALEPQYQSVYGSSHSILEKVSAHTRQVLGGGSQPAPANLPTAVGPNGHKIVYKNGAWRDANTDAVVQ